MRWFALSDMLNRERGIHNDAGQVSKSNSGWPRELAVKMLINVLQPVLMCRTAA
jgi:hypothetical protein